MKHFTFSMLPGIPNVPLYQRQSLLKEHGGNGFKIFGVIRNIKGMAGIILVIEQLVFMEGLLQKRSYNIGRINDFYLKIEKLSDLVLDNRVVSASKDQGLDIAQSFIR